MSAMKTPNSTMAAASAATGMTKASAAERSLASLARSISAASDRADDPFDQVVHLLEDRFSLFVRGASGDDFLAGVVLERPLEYRVGPLLHLAEDRVGFLAAGLGHRLAVGRHLDVALLQAAADEVLHRLAFQGFLGGLGVRREPVPLGAGQVAFRRERRLVGGITAHIDPAPLGGLHPHLRAVDVARDDVRPLGAQ